jgi:Kef-type K+ transport system membrane component KefB
VHAFEHLLLVLGVVILTAKLFGAAVRKVGQPAVLGELAAGVVLGRSVLGILDPSDPVVHALSELGVIVLLLEIGLHTDLRSLLAVGSSSLTVGLAGVVLPFGLGYGVAHAVGLDVVPSVVCGAALTATSIGISARVLTDLRQLQTKEGQVVLGAAVLDDVIGLVILSVVSQLASGSSVTPLDVAKTTAIAIGFIVVAIVVGERLVPPLFRLVQRIDDSGELGMVAMAFAMLLAFLAGSAGSALIIGAFAAGLIMHRLPQRTDIEAEVTGVGRFFVPFFFAAVGAAVDLGSLANAHVLAIGGALIVVAVVGKFVSGYAPVWFRGNKALVGAAMIPRGEVGLIFAQMGLSTGALDVSLFSAITLMVMVTTFLAPPLLGRLASRAERAAVSAARPARADDSTLSDLVVGRLPATSEIEAKPGDRRETRG